ncbi:MAG: HAD-IIB family hydrolase [Cyanobacteria bacterium SID2]|nr:HAD-IIB family hydrolase [Cyanobacteria bacterium SID2]MBP0005521.1 HAD-IIB family hydrolase [Cyanobacteria bacterium SBC]
MSFIIFTDLDGTLLNSDDYRYDAALPVLEALQKSQIPVIPVTSKTRAEVEQLRQQIRQYIDLRDPFIVENGSGAFVPQGDDRFDISDTEPWGDYHLKRFGCTYAEARAGLTEVAKHLDLDLWGFGDMGVDEIVARTGLLPEDAERAKTREFTEPFVTPKNRSADAIKDGVAKAGFRVVVGDRFSHLIGTHSGKGKAVRWLIDRFKSATDDLITIGLGNSPNDLEMLETVDRSIVIPDKAGHPHPGLRDRGWEIAPTSGCLGWATAVREILG